ncbi:MAG: DNA alkylation repair protein, partial [Chitinophagaceae bacterium]
MALGFHPPATWNAARLQIAERYLAIINDSMIKTRLAKKTNSAVITKTSKPGLPVKLTARKFIEQLKTYQSDEELKKIQRYFKSGDGQYGHGDKFMGVKMGQLFSLAKEFAEMPVYEIEKLLESPVHEVRAGGISIMDKASRNKKIT